MKILILFILIILFVALFVNQTNETFNNNIEFVISRYNENLEWLKESKYSEYPVTIYNKGINDDYYKPPFSKTFQIPNVGVCDHTYLYHIIQNYNNLANVTIFLPGSCMDEHKKEKTNNVMNKTIETNNTVIYGNEYNELGIKDSIYNFEIENWITTNNKNKEINNESKLRRCDIHPFGKWYETVFPNINVNHVTYVGIFSVSKQHIHNRSKESYETLINFVNKNKNEECSHYIERSWIAIFDPLPKEYIY
jgi:hypothetical protein